MKFPINYAFRVKIALRIGLQGDLSSEQQAVYWPLVQGLSFTLRA